MRRGIASAVVLVGVTSCGGGHALSGRDTLALGRDEGLFVLAGDTTGQLSISICRDADVMRCADVGPVSAATPLAVVQVQAGRWCLIKVECIVEGGGGEGLGVQEEIPPDEAECVNVAAGGIAYPGHFVYRTRGTGTLAEQVQSGWAARTDELQRQLRASYPNLRSVVVNPVSFARQR